MGEAALLEAFELQGSADVVTKSDLIQAIRDEGLSISDRNLSYYATEGLIPPAIRVGSRAGVYPRLVIEQLTWIIRARNAQLSIDAIRELLPLWRLLVRGRNDQQINLQEIEHAARERHLSLEATFQVPYLFTEAVLCVCPECLAEIEWTLKDGSVVHHSDDEPLTLNFVLSALNDDTGFGEVLAWTQLSLPGVSESLLGSPTTITLGVPAGVKIDPHPSRRHRPNRRQLVDRRHQEEVLPLG